MQFDDYNRLPITGLTNIGQGVYAKEDKINNVLYVRTTQETEWQEKIIFVNGRKIILRSIK